VKLFASEKKNWRGLREVFVDTTEYEYYCITKVFDAVIPDKMLSERFRMEFDRKKYPQIEIPFQEGVTMIKPIEEETKYSKLGNLVLKKMRHSRVIEELDKEIESLKQEIYREDKEEVTNEGT